MKDYYTTLREKFYVIAEAYEDFKLSCDEQDLKKIDKDLRNFICALGSSIDDLGYRLGELHEH